MGDPPAGEPVAPPPDFNDQVRDIILDGKAPPQAWRPFIKTIAFDKRWPVPSLEPLAGLTSLEALFFEDGRYWRQYEATTLAPLASLRGLRKLVLAELPISDVAPLAGLTNLMRLDLLRMP